MKKILLTTMLLVPLTAFAASDQTILFEIGVGFGGSGKVSKTKEQLANKYNNKFCFHRPQSRMVYGAVRYRYGDVETHVARWFNDADTARCGRDSWAVGLGYVIDTQNVFYNGADELYATYTPGIAYTWGKNKKFNVQDNTNTNWRLKDNWQMYNRVAIGTGNEDYNGEIAMVRYGLLSKTSFKRTGENFVTITAGARSNWEQQEVNNVDSDRGLTPPPPPPPPTSPTTLNVTSAQGTTAAGGGQTTGGSAGSGTTQTTQCIQGFNCP